MIISIIIINLSQTKNRIGEDNMLHYIGEFTSDSNTLDICDPFINQITCQMLNIDGINKKIINVVNVLPGRYLAYHISDNNTNEINFLLIIHHTYTPEMIEKFEYTSLGHSCTTAGNAICVIDKRYRNDSDFCYYLIEDDAYYDITNIENTLKDYNFTIPIIKGLKLMCEQIRIKGVYPSGKQIRTLFGNKPIWTGFRSNIINSSHWSCEVMRKFTSEYPITIAVAIKGGIASESEPGFIQCFEYRNLRGDSIAIKIDLNDDLNYIKKNEDN